MTGTSSSKRPFRPGDRVLVRLGVGQVAAMVIEDRGRLGVGGRRMYRVRALFEEPMNFETRAEDVEPDPEHPAAVA